MSSHLALLISNFFRKLPLNLALSLHNLLLSNSCVNSPAVAAAAAVSSAYSKSRLRCHRRRSSHCWDCPRHCSPCPPVKQLFPERCLQTWLLCSASCFCPTPASTRRPSMPRASWIKLSLRHLQFCRSLQPHLILTSEMVSPQLEHIWQLPFCFFTVEVPSSLLSENSVLLLQTTMPNSLHV